MLKRPLPRTVPELIADAIDFELEAASRFRAYAAYLHDRGEEAPAETFKLLEEVVRAHALTLEHCEAGRAPGETQALHASREAAGGMPASA